MENPELILVVDDQPQISALIAAILKRAGYAVKTAGDGHEAIAMLTQEPFDLVISDIMMPGADGHAVLAETKQRYPTTEVILVTAYGSTESVVRALRNGAYDFITKPFDNDELLYSVKRALAYRRLTREKEVLLALQQRQLHTRTQLVEAGQHIATTLDPREVLQTVLTVALKVIPQAELAVIYYRPNPDAFLSVTGLTQNGEPVRVSPLDDTLINNVLQHKKNLHLPAWQPAEGEPAAALLIEPLVIAGTPLGALALIAGQPHTFEEDAPQILSMLANQTAIALQNARLYTEARRADELEALYETGKALNRSLNLQDTLISTMAITRSLTGASVSNIFLYIIDDAHPRIDSVITLDDHGLLTDADRRRSAETAREVRQGRQAAHIAGNVAPDEAICTRLVVPLITGNTPLGVLELGSDHANTFSQNDVRLVEIIASQAAAAIENARLYEEVQQRLQQTEALGAISQSISNTLNLHRVLDLVVQSAVKTIPVATHSTLYLLDQTTKQFTSEAKFSRHNQSPPPEVDQVREQAIRQATTGSTAARAHWQNADHTPWSLLIAPLKVNEVVIGAISVESPRLETFHANDETLLNTFASHASIAIQNANLFRELSSAYLNLAHKQDEIVSNNRVLQALFDGITDGLYIVDNNLNVVTINQAEAKRLGRPPESIIGSRCNADLWGEAAEAVTQLVQTTLESGLEGNWESQITPGKRGPFTDRDVRAYPIFGLPGDDDQPNREKQVLQVIIFAQDVSEKRRLQASLFRSANLAAVGQLASSIAHQINNPLTVIIANTQLMEMDTPPDSFNYPIITDILEAGAQIRQIVQNLLDFSTQDVYEWFETGVEDTLADALALVAHSLRKSHIEVVKQIDPLPTIIASASHLKLLWMNLLLNARDAISARLAENGGSKTEGIITIAAGRVSDQVQIQISDNGVGLAPQHRPMLFHPFFTTKTTGKNPGLGLYTCRAIIESHDGQIDIESNPAGAGAVVTVTLPIDKR